MEPIPANAARLHEQIALNRVATWAQVVEVALSDACREAVMALRDDFRSGALTDNASLLIDDGADAAFEGLCVQTATLDSVVHRMGDPRVDLIKADVEGHEDRLLAGAQRTLKRCRPMVIAEWNRTYYERRGVNPTDTIAALLDELDYVCLRRDELTTWRLCETFSSPRPIDDLVLSPREEAARALAALSEESPVPG